ncbi:cupin domain-containing protein [Candidatus Leptofilum sp.]|uniref:cupin domain-containing protein n=1 Tax=Candidatus Leptofilum sp. TaxID=3241576 RepID=UPI003B59B792
MNLAELVIKPAQGTTWELGGTITCKVAGAQTAGAYSLLLILLEKGQGAPWHIHQREDELFYILEGACTFGLGDEVVVAEAGTTVILKKGLAHFFRNDDATPMKALITAVPGGLDRYFAEVTRAVASNNLDEIKNINRKYEIQFL